MVVGGAGLGHLLLVHLGVALHVLCHDLEAADVHLLGLVNHLALGHSVGHALLAGAGNLVDIKLEVREAKNADISNKENKISIGNSVVQ